MTYGLTSYYREESDNLTQKTCCMTLTTLNYLQTHNVLHFQSRLQGAMAESGVTVRFRCPRQLYWGSSLA